MMMVVVNGSPRKSGNTSRLLKEIARMAEDKGAEVKYHDLVDLEVEDCHACYLCKTKDACSIDDDMSGIKEEIRKADVLVLGSPIYMGAETGLMKCFADRLYAFYEPLGPPGKFKSRLPGGKRAFVLFTCGMVDGDKAFNHLNTRYFSLLVKNLEFADVRTFIIGGANPRADLRESGRAKEMLAEAKRFLNA